MSESQATQEAIQPIEQEGDFKAVLRGLIGKKVTVINPESYESVPMGFQLKEGFYPGKVVGWGQDYVIFHTVLATKKKDAGQPVQQFIPLARIKRISVMKGAIFLHL